MIGLIALESPSFFHLPLLFFCGERTNCTGIPSFLYLSSPSSFFHIFFFYLFGKAGNSLLKIATSLNKFNIFIFFIIHKTQPSPHAFFSVPFRSTLFSPFSRAKQAFFVCLGSALVCLRDSFVTLNCSRKRKQLAFPSFSKQLIVLALLSKKQDEPLPDVPRVCSSVLRGTCSSRRTVLPVLRWSVRCNLCCSLCGVRTSCSWDLDRLFSTLSYRLRSVLRFS